MPTIQRFRASRLTMYAEDHNPPHVHLVTKDKEAILAIRDGNVMAGQAPSKLIEEAQAYISANRAMLLARWATLKGER